MRTDLRAESRWLRFGLALGILLAGLLFVFLRSKCRDMPPVFPCAFHSLTGLPCLLCGGTRAMDAILAGNPQAALHLNALAFPALALVGIVTGVFLIEASTGRVIAPWERIFYKLKRLTPLLLLAAAAWWAIHMYLALKTPKPDLVDLRNPIAAKARALLLPPASRFTECR